VLIHSASCRHDAVTKGFRRELYISSFVKTKDLLDAINLVATVRQDLKPGLFGSLILSRVSCYLECRFRTEPFTSCYTTEAFLPSDQWDRELEAAYAVPKTIEN
jgi:hypothetical protein